MKSFWEKKKRNHDVATYGPTEAVTKEDDFWSCIVFIYFKLALIFHYIFTVVTDNLSPLAHISRAMYF